MCRLESYRRGLNLFTGTAVTNFVMITTMSILADRFTNELKREPGLYFLMNILALVMLTVLVVSVLLSIICAAQYLRLRKQANNRARSRIARGGRWATESGKRWNSSSTITSGNVTPANQTRR